MPLQSVRLDQVELCPSQVRMISTAPLARLVLDLTSTENSSKLIELPSITIKLKYKINYLSAIASPSRYQQCRISLR